jgi:hypothetical protein
MPAVARVPLSPVLDCSHCPRSSRVSRLLLLESVREGSGMHRLPLPCRTVSKSPCAIRRQDSPVGGRGIRGWETPIGGTLAPIGRHCRALDVVCGVGKHTILAAAGSHRSVIGAESMFAKVGKHTWCLANILRRRRQRRPAPRAASSPPLPAVLLPTRNRAFEPPNGLRLVPRLPRRSGSREVP